MPKAIWNGAVLAESDSTEVVDGNHYFPPESLHKDYFADSETNSVCGWKGTANYYTLNVNGEQNEDAAWYYADPKPEAANIKGYVAFWKGVKSRVAWVPTHHAPWFRRTLRCRHNFVRLQETWWVGTLPTFWRRSGR